MAIQFSSSVVAPFSVFSSTSISSDAPAQDVDDYNNCCYLSHAHGCRPSVISVLLYISLSATPKVRPGQSGIFSTRPGLSTVTLAS